MSEMIDTARALLRLFDRSGYGDLYVRTGDYAMFVSREGARANPLLGVASAADVLPDAQAAAPPPLIECTTVTAPHIATLVSALAVGSSVAAGEAVARIELLGEGIDIISAQAGRVEAVLATEGALLEYGAPILALA